MSCPFCGQDEDCCLEAGVEAGRAEMARAFWVAVCEQIATQLVESSGAYDRHASYLDAAGDTCTAAQFQRRSQNHAAEAAQLRAWAAKS